MSARDERMRGLIGRLSAEFLSQTSNRTSLITVTNTVLSPDRKKATVLMTVLPESEEKNALAFAKRRCGELRSYLREHGRFPTLPTIDVDIDSGEKNRQRIDEISREK